MSILWYSVSLFRELSYTGIFFQGVWADKLFGDGTRRRISQHYHAHPQNRRKKIFLVADKEKQKQESVLVVPANSFLHCSEALNMESHLSRIKASIAFYILTTELAERKKKRKNINCYSQCCQMAKMRAPVSFSRHAYMYISIQHIRYAGPKD